MSEESAHAQEVGDRARWVNDIILIGKIVAIIYVVFITFGLILGLDFNGVLSTLQRVTFFAVVYSLVVLALNLHWGYTGLFNIGVAGFMAVGVYTMALLTASPDASAAGLGLPLWVGIIGGLIASALVGLIAALPALRLRADYFAIVTLGFSEIIRLSLLSGSLRRFEFGGWTIGPVSIPEIQLGTGGGSGISFTSTDVVVDYLLFVGGDRRGMMTPIGEFVFGIGNRVGVQPSVIESVLYTTLLAMFVLLFFILLSRIAYSPSGRVLKAIREDELAARALGKNTDWMKIKVFMLGCALMGLAGMLWQGSRGYVTPDQFIPLLTFYVFVALIIGGAGSNTGAVIGAFLFASILWEGPPFVQRIIRANLSYRTPPTIYDALVPILQFDFVPLLGYFVGNIDIIRFILVGVALIVLMIWRPAGILGHRKEIAAATSLHRDDTETGLNGGRINE